MTAIWQRGLPWEGCWAFLLPLFPNLHVSSFGVIPKKGQPGKWRLIEDLSSPGGLSVNDGIDPDEFTLHYITVDQIIRMISTYGVGALIAKFDVEAAYRNIAVHPSDRYLLGLKWRKNYYIDLALPFGLRSAPYIFNSVADMVEWSLLNTHNVSDLLHYLDDFITAGPPDTNQCAANLATSMAVYSSLGLPLHPDKCIGPSTGLVVLGIELDSMAQVGRLPLDKLCAIQELIQSWPDHRWCTRRKLESLIGHLHHAAKVAWPGRTFLHRMINLLQCFRNRDHPICLNSEFRLDLQWWLQFLSSWHGVYFWLFPGMSASPDLEVTSDVSGALGFGAYFNREWFSSSWASSQASHSIAYKELFPVVIAAHLWGPQFARRHVLFWSDNEAMVYILNSRTSKIAVLMHLLRHLLSSAAHFNFSYSSQHVPRVHNCIADALSHFHWQEFWRLAPKAQLLPLPIPPQLLEELISSHKSNSASSCWPVVWLTPPGDLTHRARGSSSTFVPSWASCILVALRAPPMSGHCACSPPFWQVQFSTPLLKSLSQRSTLYILKKASQTLWSTVSIYSESFVESNRSKVPPKLNAYQLRATS